MIIALDNIRSLYNVGSILRTCAFYGVRHVILIGYTGIVKDGDQIFIHPKIKKTGMTGIDNIEFKFFEKKSEFIKYCSDNGIEIVSLEQDKRSVSMEKFNPILDKQIYILGNEVLGVSQDLLDASTHIIEIEQGKKSFYHSLNVTIAAGIFINHLNKFKL
jgi:23S rRNA (guanosine2251-2'-O)-methyltransferase